MSYSAPLAQLKRPRILVKAAQFSARSYHRVNVLKRILRCTKTPTTPRAIEMLMEREHDLNEARLLGETSYSVHLHINVLSALLGELRLSVD